MNIRHKPQMMPSVCLKHKGPQRRALLQITRNITGNRQPHFVRLELLHNLACDSAAQPKKIIFQTLNRHNKKVSLMLPRQTDQIRSIAFAAQLNVSRTLNHTNTMNFREVNGHFDRQIWAEYISGNCSSITLQSASLSASFLVT